MIPASMVTSVTKPSKTNNAENERLKRSYFAYLKETPELLR